MMLILLDDYLGKWDDQATDDHVGNAVVLLDKVNDLMDEAFTDGVDFQLNPKTKSYVAGEQYGGFRPQDCPIGAKTSAHKTGQAVDVYDPSHQFALWCSTHLDRMKFKGLYMEHPDSTRTWCHLTTRAPASGKIVFMP